MPFRFVAIYVAGGISQHPRVGRSLIRLVAMPPSPGRVDRGLAVLLRNVIDHEGKAVTIDIIQKFVPTTIAETRRPQVEQLSRWRTPLIAAMCVSPDACCRRSDEAGGTTHSHSLHQEGRGAERRLEFQHLQQLSESFRWQFDITISAGSAQLFSAALASSGFGLSGSLTFSTGKIYLVIKSKG